MQALQKMCNMTTSTVCRTELLHIYKLQFTFIDILNILYFMNPYLRKLTICI